MTIDEIREAGFVETGEGGAEMVTVRSRLDGFKDNGKTYRAGDQLHMEISVAAAAIGAGQVELVGPDAVADAAEASE